MLGKWLKSATKNEQLQLAVRARTSLAYIKLLAAGKRNASAETAANIERASEELKRVNDALPNLSRADLNKTCRLCPFYKSHCNK